MIHIPRPEVAVARFLVALLTIFDSIQRCSPPLAGAFAGEGEPFVVARGALVDEWFPEGQVLQVLYGIAMRVGDPAGAAEVVGVVDGLSGLNHSVFFMAIGNPLRKR